jgi:hypothetical protein
MKILSFRYVAGLSPSRPWFYPSAVTTGFVADNDALWQIPYLLALFAPPRILRTLICKG